jgi:hypothetical protein
MNPGGNNFLPLSKVVVIPSAVYATLYTHFALIEKPIFRVVNL